MLLVAGLINAQLSQRLWVAAAVMAALIYGTVMLYSRSSAARAEDTPPWRTPLELRAALSFGALLASMTRAMPGKNAKNSTPISALFIILLLCNHPRR